MAFTTIDDPTQYFNTITWTGDIVDSDGTGHDQSVTGVGFQPDWLWHKCNSHANQHFIVDSQRGTGGASTMLYMSTQDNNAESSNNTNGAIESIDSDGYTVTSGNDSSSKSNNAGANGRTYVAWNWLAASSASNNSDGDITSSIRHNSTAGFSLGTYTGSGTAGDTVGHGLGANPDVLIVKERGNTNSWVYSHKGLTNQSGYYMLLNTADGEATDNWFNNTSHTTSVFSTNSTPTNRSSGTYVFYAFKEIKGYSKFGKYAGNGNADGAFVYTGFRPAWIMIKKYTSGSDEWNIFDNKRDPFNVMTKRLVGNVSAADAPGTYIDFLSNGFKCRTSNNLANGSGSSYVYMCFAENPFVNSNGIPVNAR